MNPVKKRDAVDSSDNRAEVSGIAAGVIAGAVAGSHALDPQSEHAYWREHFRELPATKESAGVRAKSGR